MLEKANDVTREGKYTHITYARWADDLIVTESGTGFIKGFKEGYGRN